MSIEEPGRLAEKVKGKKVLLMAGQLCNDIDFGSKTLGDYAVEISNKIDAPIAATGNTPKVLREKGAKSVKKMWAAEIPNFIRWDWEDDVIDKKPDVLLLIGYGPPVAEGLTSSVVDSDTIVLGNTYVKGATYSLSESKSLGEWQRSLEEFVKSL